jgi:hypothetical protein
MCVRACVRLHTYGSSRFCGLCVRSRYTDKLLSALFINASLSLIAMAIELQVLTLHYNRRNGLQGEHRPREFSLSLSLALFVTLSASPSFHSLSLFHSLPSASLSHSFSH